MKARRLDLHVAAAVGDVDEGIGRQRKTPAADDFALVRGDAGVVRAFGVRGDPRQTGAVVVLALGVFRNPTRRRVLVNAPS